MIPRHELENRTPIGIATACRRGHIRRRTSFTSRRLPCHFHTESKYSRDDTATSNDQQGHLDRPITATLSLRRFYTPRTAMRPASLVAWRCWSLKWAGTVMTAALHALPKAFSATRLSSTNTMADTSSGAICFFSPSQETSTLGRPFPPSTTRKGKDFASSRTTLSYVGCRQSCDRLAKECRGLKG